MNNYNVILTNNYKVILMNNFLWLQPRIKSCVDKIEVLISTVTTLTQQIISEEESYSIDSLQVKQFLKYETLVYDHQVVTCNSDSIESESVYYSL